MIEMAVNQANNPIRIQTNLGLFKFALQRKDFKYFSNLMEALLTGIRRYMQSTLKI